MTKQEVIQHLTTNADYRAFRGNTIWLVRDNKIICHDTWITESGWEWDTVFEGHFKETNCPVKYLDLTEEIDPVWRNKARNNRKHIQEIKKQIRDAFKNLEEGEKLQVILERPGYNLTVTELVVNSADHYITGRASNNSLYRVLPRLVQEINIIGEKTS